MPPPALPSTYSNTSAFSMDDLANDFGFDVSSKTTTPKTTSWSNTSTNVQTTQPSVGFKTPSSVVCFIFNYLQ